MTISEAGVLETKSYKPSDILADKLGLSVEETAQFVIDTPNDWIETLCPEYFMYGVNGDIVGEILNFCSTRSSRNNADAIRAWNSGSGFKWKSKKERFYTRSDVGPLINPNNKRSKLMENVRKAYKNGNRDVINYGETIYLEAALLGVIHYDEFSLKEFEFLVRPFRDMFKGFNFSLINNFEFQYLDPAGPHHLDF